MTQHEFLAFVEGLHEHMKKVTGKPGYPWPDQVLLSQNFRLNRNLWGRTWPQQWNSAMTEAIRHGWVVAGIGEGCVRGCHAIHVRVTAEGAQTLRLMNERGCGPCQVHGKTREHCEAKAEFDFHGWKGAA